MKRKFRKGDIVQWRKDAFMSSDMDTSSLAMRARQIHGKGMVIQEPTDVDPDFLLVFWFKIGHTWDWIVQGDLELVSAVQTATKAQNEPEV